MEKVPKVKIEKSIKYLNSSSEIGSNALLSPRSDRPSHRTGNKWTQHHQIKTTTTTKQQ
jgi:hypothetical protein